MSRKRHSWCDVADDSNDVASEPPTTAVCSILPRLCPLPVPSGADKQQDTRFRLEVQQRSCKAIKAKSAGLQEQVETLRFYILDLQLPACTSCYGDDLASSAKDDAAAGTHEDGSTGTLSTTLRYRSS